MAKKATKVKKEDTFIDMTAMSDMMVLLLTFFMLTATFLPLEPVQVTAPMSVSPTKIPEIDWMTVLIENPSGRVFFNMSDETKERKDQKVEVLVRMGSEYGITFNDKQKIAFRDDVTHVGVPMRMMPAFLDLPAANRSDEVRKHGIPMDSANNQLGRWVVNARIVGGKEVKLAIKADRSTEYPKVAKVMKTLVEVKEARYSLITALRGMPDGF